MPSEGQLGAADGGVARVHAEPFLQTLEKREERREDREWLESEARKGVEHRRVPRTNDAERATSGRATCRSCRDTIAKGAGRISLVYREDGRFEPSAFICAGCARAYFETAVKPRVSRQTRGRRSSASSRGSSRG